MLPLASAPSARLDPAPTIDVVSELDACEVARDLVAALGRPLVALLTDVSDTRVVRSWEEAGVEPKGRREAILRYALQTTHILLTRFDARVAQRWFVGGNSSLGDDAPSAVLRTILDDHSRADQVGPRVLNAARAFVNR